MVITHNMKNNKQKSVNTLVTTVILRVTSTLLCKLFSPKSFTKQPDYGIIYI
jgi:hypothetical protein